MLIITEKEHFLYIVSIKDINLSSSIKIFGRHLLFNYFTMEIVLKIKMILNYSGYFDLISIISKLLNNSVTHWIIISIVV